MPWLVRASLPNSFQPSVASAHQLRARSRWARRCFARICSQVAPARRQTTERQAAEAKINAERERAEAVLASKEADVQKEAAKAAKAAADIERQQAEEVR